MACCLLGTEPGLEPMLTLFTIGPLGTHSMKSDSKYKVLQTFYSGLNVLKADQSRKSAHV